MASSPTTDKPRGAEAIKQALAHVPLNPGVYLMKDARGRVIYVGKAKRLKNRLTSYTRPTSGPTWYANKVATMVGQVASVEFVITASEKEALLLENTLIKKHRPRYNADLRDDKSYPYFRLSLEHDFPRLSLVRRPKLSDGAQYYGPFGSAGAARQTMYLLQRIFPLRRCSDHTLRNRARPCLDYETGRCPAPCADKISKEDYALLVQQMQAFFAGQGEELARRLQGEMEKAAQGERFEEAALLRDRWQALSRTLERQRVSAPQEEDIDAVALHLGEDGMRLAQVRVRGGQVVGSRVHDLSRAAQEPGETMSQALLALYELHAPPPLVLVSAMPADPSLVAEVLGEKAGRKVELRLPQRGEKRKLMEMAKLNAAQPRHEGPGPAAVLERLAKKLGLPEPPETMECLDISHLGGSLTVAGLSAMREGKADKSAYRRYKVLGGEGGGDDYAAMAHVLARRLSGDDPPPDLLVLDGGKGQLSMAVQALVQAAPEHAPALASIAKGRAQGEPDRIYLPQRKNPVNLKASDPALLLVMRLRDEAHRFAVSYHRLLRKKALTRSILEEVPGIGPKKRSRLLKSFGSLAAVKKAGEKELQERGGLDAATARRLASFLAALDTAQPPK
ncbi:MAG: excinuclease ABC subunit UvrC [Desulfarculaceae bacterium]|nr:excinuclease ABC subunit UvrC [Desulfarculaceae bacterium]MCF8046942.1 excinuclease ABC subunit UvrC [Desulfarculaceae bacterium]MCF8064964.1 excinuclease ABC subunit UvrC [Desulfarculaceae bacterium]MCF8097490.1 excinuclease ABC subunit UvrC [Desulfarculaceae bacterium]MCF8124253.1 excinuclease ABC subunit UvrC [Desulfarculaceae bacterium]